MNLQEMILPALVLYFVTMCSTAWKGIASKTAFLINWGYYSTAPRHGKIKPG